MPPSTRRTVLASVGGPLAALLVGCSSWQSESPPAGGTTDTPSAGRTTSTRSAGDTTPTARFEGLSTEGMQAECPTPEYASHATTPVPYPTPAAPDDADAAVELATDIEAAYLDNWVVLNYGPLPTPATPAPHEVQYPDISASYQSRAVLQQSSGVVVHLQYARVVDGEVAGRYTVNYYHTASAVARAEANGYHQPGPYSTEAGVLLSCW